MMDFTPVLEASKDLEYLVTTFDPVFDDLITAIEIIKEFIVGHQLVIYGGTAIDYALRLRGDKIYPDDLLKIPDLDFYSPNSIEHSYQLANILYRKGFKHTRAITAQHVETMRVDLRDNHFIADITYRPQKIFDSLPYLTYNGMRIIHPHFQRIDVHSSLSFPYDNVPREVIFERWNKDIKRFNKLAMVYPITEIAESEITTHTKMQRCTIVITAGCIYTGFVAYAIIYHEFSRIMRELGADIPGSILAASIAANGKMITYDTIDNICEMMHFDIYKAAALLSLEDIQEYEPHTNLIPGRIEGKSGRNIVKVLSSKHRLLSTNSVSIGDLVIRSVNIQPALKYFICMYFISLDSQDKLRAGIYLARYISLMNMISAVEDAMEGLSEDVIAKITRSILFLSINVYGNENINLAREVALSRLYYDLRKEPLMVLPPNYYPDRNEKNGLIYPRPDISQIKIFNATGNRIK